MDSRGRSPFGRWFENLDTTPAAKVVAVVTRMEAGNFGDHRGGGGDILECHIHSGPGYRIYVAIDMDTVIICPAVEPNENSNQISRMLRIAGRTTKTAKFKENDMPLTRDFKETVQARVQRDPEFRQRLFQEGVECLLAGDIDTGNSLLRTYINATIGFSALGKLTQKQPKSLMRMLGPQGNPNARNLFDIIGCIQRHEGIQLGVTFQGAEQVPTLNAD